MVGSLVAVVVGSAIGTPAVLAATAPSTPIVDITKFAFTPTEITVAPGSRIVWVNHDEVPHTVTGDDNHLASKGMDTDDRYEHVERQERRLHRPVNGAVATPSVDRDTRRRRWRLALRPLLAALRGRADPLPRAANSLPRPALRHR
jgi:hypothetical protein